MSKGRLEAFSDGVLIIITIMVLEMKVPHGTDLAVLQPLLPVFLSYVLSFSDVGTFWNNHHHLLHAARHVNGRILWANLHLLFWLSLVPFATGWMCENHFAQATALHCNHRICPCELPAFRVPSGGNFSVLQSHPRKIIRNWTTEAGFPSFLHKQWLGPCARDCAQEFEGKQIPKSYPCSKTEQTCYDS